MPKPLPKWEMWKHVPTLTAEQAVALTLGVDPHKVRQWGGGEDIWVYDNLGSGSCSTVEGFTDRLFLFKQCFGVYGGISPSQLTVWAKSVDWNMPSELKELATGAPAAKGKAGAGTNPSGDEIPGKMPNITIGKLAIKAAWQIESKTGKRATAKQVIERLQTWVDHKDNPEAVAELTDKIPNGVKWVTRAGKENKYDVGACQKTLENWNKSRT